MTNRVWLMQTLVPKVMDLAVSCTSLGELGDGGYLQCSDSVLVPDEVKLGLPGDVTTVPWADADMPELLRQASEGSGSLTFWRGGVVLLRMEFIYTSVRFVRTGVPVVSFPYKEIRPYFLGAFKMLREAGGERSIGFTFC